MSSASVVRVFRGTLLVFLALTPASIRAQGLDSTIALVNAAESAGDHLRAAHLYFRMYALTGFDPAPLAGAAVAAAEGRDNRLALALFRRAVGEGYLDSAFIHHVERDSSLSALRSDPEWANALADAKRRVASLDRPLRAELLDLASRDQKNRDQIGAVMARFGRNSSQGDSAVRALDRADAPLLTRIREIMATHGWPGRSRVGDDGAHAAWLVVQHAPVAVQRELLPRIRAAISNGEGRFGDLALLEDRVLVADGRPQLYGSQTRFSATGGAPMLDSIAVEPCVDVRRSAMGLEPIADYLKRLGATYTPRSEQCIASEWSLGRPAAATSTGVVHGVRVMPGTITLAAGGSQRLSGSVDADAVVVVRDLSWRSTNPLVAAVDAAGAVTAISAGTATIVATAVADLSAMGATEVTVTTARPLGSP